MCGIVGALVEGLIVEHAAHELQASCLILSKGSLIEDHAKHQQRASCLCVASFGISWKASLQSAPLVNSVHPI